MRRPRTRVCRRAGVTERARPRRSSGRVVLAVDRCLLFAGSILLVGLVLLRLLVLLPVRHGASSFSQKSTLPWAPRPGAGSGSTRPPGPVPGLPSPRPRQRDTSLPLSGTNSPRPGRAPRDVAATPPGVAPRTAAPLAPPAPSTSWWTPPASYLRVGPAVSAGGPALRAEDQAPSIRNGPVTAPTDALRHIPASHRYPLDVRGPSSESSGRGVTVRPLHAPCHR